MRNAFNPITSEFDEPQKYGQKCTSGQMIIILVEEYKQVTPTKQLALECNTNQDKMQISIDIIKVGSHDKCFSISVYSSIKTFFIYI